MNDKEIKLYTALFVVLGVGEQISNGLLKTTFSLTDLLSVFGILMSYYCIIHGINSKWNSGYPQTLSAGAMKAPVNTQVGGKN